MKFAEASPSPRVFGVFAASLLLSLTGLRAAPATTEYRGFTIDESHIKNLSEIAEMRAATKEQIDMVHAVGLSAETLKFFQTVPFELVPAGTFRSPTPGVYGNRVVKVSTGIIKIGHKPVLLHELLHAYHDQRLSKGTRNPAVIGFYDKAKTLGAYAAKSHMMENPNEFFACSATAYLFGVTAQEPFKRDKVKTSQPELFAYLKALFGSDAGDYAGSLTRS